MNKEIENIQHPEGKIQLLDGRVLDCYPLQELKSEVDNELKIDTTGEYLSLKKRPKTRFADDVDETEKAQTEALLKLFFDNAFVLFDNRERILSDSRMFLSPLPIKSGLAYTGTSGFNNPTLGIYLEFWLNCPDASIMENNGEKWFLWHIAGSALSGANSCGFVNEQGNRKCEHVSSFGCLCHTFIEINTRYDEAKSRYETYSLHQVLSILQNEGKMFVDNKNTQIFFLEQANKELQRQLTSSKSYTEHLTKKLHMALLELKGDEIKAFWAEYKGRNATLDKRLSQIQSERLKLRKQLKSGEIDNVHFQKLWTPLKREKNEIVFALRNYIYETLHSIFPDDSISLYDVEEFMKKT